MTPAELNLITESVLDRLLPAMELMLQRHLFNFGLAAGGKYDDALAEMKKSLCMLIRGQALIETHLAGDGHDPLDGSEDWKRN